MKKSRIRYAPAGRTRTVMDLKTELREWAKAQAAAQVPTVSLTRWIEDRIRADKDRHQTG